MPIFQIWRQDMNIKRYFLAVLAVLVTIIVTNIIIHSFILMDTYSSLKQIWRPDMMDLMWIMYVTDIALAFLFVYIFTKGYENKGILEGVRYGLIMGLLLDGLGAFGQYMIYPIPLSLAAQWFVYGVIRFVILGIIVALVYRPRTA
jgi:hypothetical protein